ncbi:MAG: hypothetical protein K9M57_03345 [Phycisphaerae bacterium]|nr:hypothetical protein [Phycisphaerae bacterium]
MKKKVLLMLLAVVMALLFTANPASAAELIHDETVRVSTNGSAFNVSVYPGKASYSGTVDGVVEGVFGDGTVLDYALYWSTGDAMAAYAEGAESLIGSATATNYSGDGKIGAMSGA